MMHDDDDNESQNREEEPAQAASVILNSTELFSGDREIWIIHNGERYRLRITRKNKLILQK
jgi:hemin uptake protein HemP